MFALEYRERLVRRGANTLYRIGCGVRFHGTLIGHILFMGPGGPITLPRRYVTQADEGFSRFDVTVQQHVVFPDFAPPQTSGHL